jgi:hypothetical protein
MIAVAVVAVLLAGGIWAEEMRQRRNVLLEWAEYHEAVERDAKDLLWTVPWSHVIRIHRLEAHLKARRAELEDEQGRADWTPDAATAAEEELNRSAEDIRQRISEAKAYLGEHLSMWRKEAEEQAGLKREFERAASRPWSVSLPPAHPPDRGFRCGTMRLEMVQTVKELQSKGASIAEVLPDRETEIAGVVAASHATLTP